MKKCIATLACLFFLTGLVKAQDGQIDASFGLKGIARIDEVGLFYPHIFTAVQSENKIVVATTYQSYNDHGPDARGFMVRCFHDDGSPDADFVHDCRIETGVGASGDVLHGMVILSDGKIILAGTERIFGLLPDGSPDYSFGDSGKISAPGFIVNSMALQSEGRIVLAGHNAGGDVYTARLLSDGKKDDTYGADGIASYHIPGASLYSAFSIAIAANDQIVIGGQTLKSPGAILLQFTANGEPDTAFENSCYKQLTVNGSDAVITAIAVQADGKICVAGNLSGSAFLARLKGNGTFDKDVNGSGILLNDLVEMPGQHGGAGFINSTVSIQKDGRILYAYNCPKGNRDNFHIRLHRFRPDGSIDRTFGLNGALVTSLGDLDAPGAILLPSDSKILLAAASGYQEHSTNYPTLSSVYLVCYLTSLQLGAQSLQPDIHAVTVFPNPVGQSATITYTMSSDDLVSIELVDVKGRTIRHFISRQMRNKGVHSEKLQFSSALPAGKYLVAISNRTGMQHVRVTK